jgi:hypothetical protein
MLLGLHRSLCAALAIVHPIARFPSSRPREVSRSWAAREERCSSTSAKSIRSASTTHESSSPACQPPVVRDAFTPLSTDRFSGHAGRWRWLRGVSHASSRTDSTALPRPLPSSRRPSWSRSRQGLERAEQVRLDQRCPRNRRSRDGRSNIMLPRTQPSQAPLVANLVMS